MERLYFVLCFKVACEPSPICCSSPDECSPSSTVQKCHTVSLKLGGIYFHRVQIVTELGFVCYNNRNKVILVLPRNWKALFIPAASAPVSHSVPTPLGTHSGHEMDADLKSNYPIYFQILVLLTEMLFRKKTKKLNIYVFLFKEKQDLSTSVFLSLYI